MVAPLPDPRVDGQRCTQALHAPLCPGRIPVPVRFKIWLLTLAAAILLPALARAHAILEESDPPAGASVKAGPVDLRFRYNSRIDQGRSRLTVIRARPHP